MIQACIFDLDGVLVDTAKYHFVAWSELAGKLKIPFTEADNERLKGVSRMDSLEIILELGNLQLSEAEKIELAAEKNERYLELISSMNPDEVLPGVIDFLKEVKKQELKTALGSASKNAKQILDRTGLHRFFDVVVDGTDISKAKPDPQVFLTGANRLGILPEHCVVFEDAVAGIKAAHNAGMRCVGIGSEKQLADTDIVIPGFDVISPGRFLDILLND